MLDEGWGNPWGFESPFGTSTTGRGSFCEETARTANPAQTIAILGVWKRSPAEAVDRGNPLCRWIGFRWAGQVLILRCGWTDHGVLVTPVMNNLYDRDREVERPFLPGVSWR